MPIHDLGYRSWKGRLIPDLSRWWVIGETGVRRAMQSTWVKRILFLAWMPLLLFAVAFVLYEKAALGDGGIWQQGAVGVTNMSEELRDSFQLNQGMSPADIIATLNEKRHLAWTYILRTFFRYPQGTGLLILVGIVAPRLISEDVRSRAFLFYFSRPLSRFEYVVGKSSTVWLMLLGITTLPALVLYLLGIGMSQSFGVIADTWDIPLRIIAASVVFIVPSTALALCFSSLCKESWYALFAWFAIWILGFVACMIVSGQRPNQQARVAIERMEKAQELQRRIDDGEDPAALADEFEALSRPVRQPKVHHFEELFSLPHTFGAVQSWIFGFEEFSSVKYFVYMLITITVVSTCVLFRRVSAPMRA